ncbi:MAG: hypothetical protein JKX84_07225 [Flavobacteriales bacterium]|nr:hypothetical protein [Flavobacteriales bacterium]
MTAFLLVLISWALAFAAWFPVGSWFVTRFGNIWKDRPVHQLILSTVVGAALNSSLLGFTSIWLPINSIYALLFAITGAILFRKPSFVIFGNFVKSIYNWSYASKLSAVAFLIIALLCSAHESLNNDSGLYYIQFIKWINSYPVVPGLANLHDRLGFNSHWHLLSAAYDLQPLVSSHANDLNGLLLLLIGLGCIDSAQRSIKKPTLFHAIWALFPLPFFLLMRFLTSAAPDLPSTLLPLIYFSLLITADKKRYLIAFCGMLIAFAATIKVISILHGIILIPLFFTLLKNKELKPILLLIIGVGFIVAPWLIRNVIQTGYLIFPLETIDLFSFDWKVPNELAGNARKMVDIHARTGSYDLTNYEKPVADWLPFWLSVQSKSVLALLIFVTGGSLLTTIISTFNLIRKKSENPTYHLFFGITVLFSLVFWWKSGPNPRFAYGVIFFFFAYALAVVSTMTEPTKKLLRFVPILALLPMALLTRTVWNEPGPTRPTEFSVMKSTGRPIYYPTKTDKCWEQRIPCANKKRTDIRFRGNEMGEGFVNTQRQN